MNRAPLAKKADSDFTARQVLFWATVLGLVVRLAVLSQTTSLDTKIVDEQHYRRLAASIESGNGFAAVPGSPTSIRPPLYPAMVAALWAVTGPHSLQAVRAVQVVLSLATVWLVYLIGVRVFNRRVACYAAAATWLYPSFIFFDFLILTETLFTLLLVAFTLVTIWLIESSRASVAVACGVALGLAALTRSVLWPVPLVLCPLLAGLIRAPLLRRLALSAFVLVGYVLVVAPWAIRNTRLQHTLTIVDTMGGINLRMGNYEYTPDDRMWDAVSLTGDKSWVNGISVDYPGTVTEGEKDKWAQAKAIEYMRQHPGQTFRRSLIKFADFWGLEREFLAGVQAGLFSPPQWFAVVASLTIIVGYALVATLGVAGIWLAAPRDWRAHGVLLFPVVLIVAAHTIVFGHSRYHLPLMPILALYAASLATLDPASFRWGRGPVLAGAAISVGALAAVWIRQIAIVDSSRIAALLERIGG